MKANEREISEKKEEKNWNGRCIGHNKKAKKKQTNRKNTGQSKTDKKQNGKHGLLDLKAQQEQGRTKRKYGQTRTKLARQKMKQNKTRTDKTETAGQNQQ